MRHLKNRKHLVLAAPKQTVHASADRGASGNHHAVQPDVADRNKKPYKESQTVLLRNKGSKHDLEDWRPTALANNLYKLWTGVNAECLYSYAENINILSSTHTGSSKQKSTIWQLLNMINIISDAKVIQQDLYFAVY